MIITMFLWPLVLVVTVAVVALIVAGIRAGESSNDGGREMIKNVYIYLVLFVTLMMTIGGSVGAFMAIADIVAPTPFYHHIEDYKRTIHDQEGVKDISEVELQKRYQAAAEVHRAQQIEQAKNALIKSFGWIIIPLPVFIYFQRRLVGKEA